MKPIFASSRMTARRVKASARKITSGSVARISLMSHSQKAKGLVCGLSTRKTFTPRSTQWRMTASSASQSSRQSSEPKLTL